MAKMTMTVPMPKGPPMIKIQLPTVSPTLLESSVYFTLQGRAPNRTCLLTTTTPTIKTSSYDTLLLSAYSLKHRFSSKNFSNR